MGLWITTNLFIYPSYSAHSTAPISSSGKGDGVENIVQPIHTAMKKTPKTTNRIGMSSAQRTGGSIQGHINSQFGFAGAKSQMRYTMAPKIPKTKIIDPKLLSFICYHSFKNTLQALRVFIYIPS